MRVMVTGAAGQLGASIVTHFSSSFDVQPLTHRELNITDRTAVLRTVLDLRPDVIINCAAYNHVDKAESDPVNALDTNGFGVLTLGAAAARVGATIVHYSTDFVFDGEAHVPYTEESEANPRSTYGLSKLLGEWFALDGPASYVLRVESLFGGSPAKSSIDRILHALVNGEPTRVFVDRTVSPSYVPDVVTATERLLTTRAQYGLYHCVNNGSTSWMGLAQEAARLLGREPLLIAVRLADANLNAPRPRYCALSNQKLTLTGIVMPTWEQALARHIERFQSGTIELGR